MEGALHGPQLSGTVKSGSGDQPPLEVAAWWSGDRMRGTLATPGGKQPLWAKCEAAGDSTTGALGTFSGELPPEEPWPEKYRQPSAKAPSDDSVKDPRAFYCALRHSRAAEVGSLGLLQAIEANCPNDFSVAGGGGSGACHVGPPEFNPPGTGYGGGRFGQCRFANLAALAAHNVE
ncbi:MAG: hypothetical protein N3C12_02235 [Candidatus Binatia bacterium]|nr:hypothetical protein [Candidatus Binatia bacterium]